MFEVEYIEKKSTAKSWMDDSADLTAMYRIFKQGITVTIWYDSKDDSISTDITTRKRGILN